MNVSVSSAASSPVAFYPGRTGNPFVDWGLAVVAAARNIDEANSVTVETLRDIVGDGIEIARRQQVLKAFNLVFGSNTPLHNPKKKNGLVNKICGRFPAPGACRESGREPVR